MKNCIACNEPLEDDVKFCWSCGGKQPERQAGPQETLVAQEEKASVLCEKCGKELQSEWMACPFCLTPVPKLAGTPPVAALVLPDAIDDSIEASSAAISPDGKYLVMKTSIGGGGFFERILKRSTLVIIDTTLWEGVFSNDIYEHNGGWAAGCYEREVWSVSPDGNYIVAINNELAASAKILDIKKNEATDIVHGLYINRKESTANAFSYDSKRLAFCHEGAARVWSVENKRELLSFKSGDITFIAFSPDGRYLVTMNGIEGSLWDARNGNRLFNLGDHLSSAAFTHDGKRIVTLNYNNIVGWDLNNGNCLFQFAKGTEKFCKSICLSNDDRIIVVGYGDGEVQMLDAENGEVLKQFNAGEGLKWVQFTQDGQKLVSYDGSWVKIWVGG